LNAGLPMMRFHQDAISIVAGGGRLPAHRDARGVKAPAVPERDDARARPTKLYGMAQLGFGYPSPSCAKPKGRPDRAKNTGVQILSMVAANPSTKARGSSEGLGVFTALLGAPRVGLTLAIVDASQFASALKGGRPNVPLARS
jgi:hypothetical protein